MDDKKQARKAYYNSEAVDHYACSHLNAQSPVLNEHLFNSIKNCQANGFPDWGAIPSQGKFLMLQCRMIDVRHMLEIGTLGGQSAIWCASANKDIKITTIEMNPKYAAVARENLQYAGLEERVEIIEGKAQEILPKLALEIRSGKRARFGLVSVDVQTFGETWDLVDSAIGLCGDRACLVVHCAVRPSNLSIPTVDETENIYRGSRELVEKAGKDKRLDAVLLMTDGEQNYDTLIAAVRAVELELDPL